MNKPSPMLIGIGAGLLFFAHAMIPNSHAWPLIWPMLGGAIAVLLYARAGASRGLGASLAAAAKAGGIAGLIFFAGTVLALMVLQAPSMQSTAAAWGAGGPIVVNGPVLLAVAAAAMFGLVLASVAGAAAHPFAKRA